MTRKGWVIIAALLSLSMPLRGDVTKVPSSATTTSVASTSAGDLELRDSSQLAAESLTNGALTAGTSWARTNDFALASDAATYTHSAGSGSFQQTSAAAAIPWAASGISRWFSFTYTTSALTGAPVCTIPNTFALTAQTLSTTAGAHTLVFQAMAATVGDFKVSCTSGAAATITFDTLSLKRINGGDLVVNGTLTVRDPDCVNSVLYGTTGGLVSCEAALGYDAATDTLTSSIINYTSGKVGNLTIGADSTHLTLYDNTALTPDGDELLTGTLSNSVHVAPFGAFAFDFNNGRCGTAACANPSLIVHSPDQVTTEYTQVSTDATGAGKIQNNFSEITVGFRKTAITEASAQAILRIGIPTSTNVYGATVFYTISDVNGANYVGRTGSVKVQGGNSGGTATCTINTTQDAEGEDGSQIVTSNAATLTYTWTNVVSTTNCDLSLNAASSEGANTYTITGTAIVTGNSSAITVTPQ